MLHVAVLEAASRTEVLLSRLMLPFDRVGRGTVQFAGKLGDIAMAALRFLLMPVGLAVRFVGAGPAATVDMSQFALPTRASCPRLTKQRTILEFFSDSKSS